MFYSGHTQFVKVLLENNADVNAQDDYDYTPLHRSANNSK